jgi:hypothetical protein
MRYVPLLVPATAHKCKLCASARELIPSRIRAAMAGSPNRDSGTKTNDK